MPPKRKEKWVPLYQWLESREAKWRPLRKEDVETFLEEHKGRLPASLLSTPLHAIVQRAQTIASKLRQGDREEEGGTETNVADHWERLQPPAADVARPSSSGGPPAPSQPARQLSRSPPPPPPPQAASVEWEFEAVPNAAGGAAGFAWEYMDTGIPLPPTNEVAFWRLGKIRQEQLEGLLGDHVLGWRVLVKRRRKQCLGRPTYDAYWRVPKGRILRSMHELEGYARQVQHGPGPSSAPPPVVRKPRKIAAPPPPAPPPGPEPRAAGPPAKAGDPWDEKLEEQVLRKYNALVLLRARIKDTLAKAEEQRPEGGAAPPPGHSWPANHGSSFVHSSPETPPPPAPALEERSAGVPAGSADRAPERAVGTAAAHRLRLLPGARDSDAVPGGGRSAPGAKRHRREGPSQVAMLSWTLAEAGVGLPGSLRRRHLAGNWRPASPEEGVESRGTHPEAAHPEACSAARILLEREMGLSGDFGRALLRPAGPPEGAASRGGQDPAAGPNRPSLAELPATQQPMTPAEEAVPGGQHGGAGRGSEEGEGGPFSRGVGEARREAGTEGLRLGSLTGVSGPEASERPTGTGQEGLHEGRAQRGGPRLPNRQSAGERRGGRGYLRPSAVHRPGRRWTAFCEGWQGIQRQWEAPGVVLQRAMHRSWTPTWGAYTSNFAATPTANREQGVQKVLDVRFNPEGHPQLVCGCNAAPNELLLYDLESGRARELAGHGGQIQAVEFAGNGTLLVSCAANLLKVWDAGAASCLHTMGPAVPHEAPADEAGHRKKISAMVVNQWEPWLVASSGGPGDAQVLLWNARSGELAGDLNAAFREESGRLVAMDTLVFGDRSTLLCGSDAPAGLPAVVQLLDVEAGREAPLRSFPAHDKFITSIHVDPQSRTILTGSGDGTVGLFDMRSCDVIGRLPVGPHCEVTSVSFSACARFFQASSVANRALVWDTRMLALQRGPPPGSGPPPLRWAGERGCRALHLLSHGRPMPTIANAGQLPGYVDEGDEGINDARWMHGSSRLFTVSGNGSMAMWDVALGQPCLQHVAAHSRSINTVAVSGDDLLVATGGDDQKVVLYQPVEQWEKRKWRLTHPLCELTMASV